MNPKQLVTISKFLSKHLRHEPESLGLTLADGGWVDVQTLLDACAKHGFPISRDQLDEVVRTSDKKRFAFDDSGTRIRANQGHSTPVDLQLQPVEPPALLYHGSATKNEAAVELLVKGLDSAEPLVQLGSLRALLERRSQQGQREILRRLPDHADAWRPTIDDDAVAGYLRHNYIAQPRTIYREAAKLNPHLKQATEMLQQVDRKL